LETGQNKQQASPHPIGNKALQYEKVDKFWEIVKQGDASAEDAAAIIPEVKPFWTMGLSPIFSLFGPILTTLSIGESICIYLRRVQKCQKVRDE